MADRDEKPDASRTIAGRYRLDERIANGPFAEVWRATDLQVQSTVAVKLLKPEHVDSVEKFIAHVQHAATLIHPGIVLVLHVDQEDGNCFIVSEFIEGGSLADFVGRQILSTPQVIRWMSDVGEALEYAHSIGIIHRDIKPANILINLEGRALLTDFGIDRCVSDPKSASFSAGKIDYLAPEQGDGKTVDVRSDNYSLAVVMYELLTGKLPYQSTEKKALRIEIAHGVHLDSVSIPGEMRHICRKALAHNQDDRYPSAEAFVDDLRRISARSSTRRMMIFTTGVILFLAGFAISSWWSEARPITDLPVPMSESVWIEHVNRLSAKGQIEAIKMRLAELNEGFSDDLTATIEGGTVVELIIKTDDVRDISPIRVLTGLKTLNCFGTYGTKSNGRLISLAPLKGMQLTKLMINDNERIDDLSPLEGMPLIFLHCGRTNVSDLTPLKNAPLTVLVCRFTNVSDLSPLSGMKLKELYCDHTGVADLSPLEGMPLEQLHCGDTLVSSLAPLRDLPLQTLDCYGTLVSDLSPLKGKSDLVSLNVLSTNISDFEPLKDLPNIKLLWSDIDPKRDEEIVRSLKSLEFINDNPASVFWQQSSEKDRDRE